MINIVESFNEELFCPILKLPIENPVITDDGHTYEK